VLPQQQQRTGASTDWSSKPSLVHRPQWDSRTKIQSPTQRRPSPQRLVASFLKPQPACGMEASGTVAAQTWTDCREDDDDDCPPVVKGYLMGWSRSSPNKGLTTPPRTPTGHARMQNAGSEHDDEPVPQSVAPPMPCVPSSVSPGAGIRSPTPQAPRAAGQQEVDRRKSLSIRATSPAVELSAADRGIAKKCVRCVVWGSYFPHSEFRSRIGVTITEARHLYESMMVSQAWGRLGAPSEPVTKHQMLVHNCINEVLLGVCKDWKRWFGDISIRRVEETYARVTKHQCAIGMMLERAKNGWLMQFPTGRSPRKAA
jgi:hypothetical protein